ncbi:MAG: TetR/AcrR family transcriptional regulator [Pseudomonadota bacterium]
MATRTKTAGAPQAGAEETGARRKQAERRAESTQKILDCAELNFARLGFHGVTLNDVATQCGMQTALIRYYYDDKQALLNAVLERRAQVINELRLRTLGEYENKAGSQMTIEGLLDAYLSPIFDTFGNEEGWRTFGALVAQIGILPAWGGQGEIHRDNFDPVIKSFLVLLRRLAIGVGDADLFWYYHLLSGAVIVSLAQTGQIDRISAGLCKSSDLKTAGKHIASVFAAGFTALPRAPAKPAKIAKTSKPPKPATGG